MIFLIFICSSATVCSPHFAVERILWQRMTLLLAPRQRHLQSPQVRFPLHRSCTEAFDFWILPLSDGILFPLTIPCCRQLTTSNSPGSISSILQIVMTREWSYTCSSCNPIYSYPGRWDPICFILQNGTCFLLIGHIGLRSKWCKSNQRHERTRRLMAPNLVRYPEALACIATNAFNSYLKAVGRYLS